MPTLHIVRVQLDPADLEELVKYVQFSDIVPSPQLFSKTQQTPKLEAQDPEEDPLKEMFCFNLVISILLISNLPFGSAF